MRTVQVRMSDEDEARLDKLIAAWEDYYDQSQASAHPILVTTSSALRDLLKAWDEKTGRP